MIRKTKICTTKTWKHKKRELHCFEFEVLITILMLKYLQFKASYDWNLSNLVASLRLNTFTKMDLWKWLNEPFTPPPDTLGDPNEGVQLSIF